MTPTFNWSRPRHSAGVLAATAALLLGAGGLAYAQVPSGSDGTISACFKAADGILRIIDTDAGQTCAAKEQQLQWNQQGLKGDTGATGPQGDPGAAGASAYDLAVAGGYEGTQEQWLASLVGPKGDTGAQGPQGEQGPKGDQGDKGDTGASAYEVWLAQPGNAGGSETDFLNSLSVQWSNVLGMPAGFADGTDDDGSTKVAELAGALATDDGTPNENTDLVSWTRIMDLTTVTGDGVITGQFLRDGSVGRDDLGSSSVGFDELVKGDVRGEGTPSSTAPTNGNIALNSITGANIADFTIHGGQDNAFTPNQIADGTLTSYDLGMNAVTADKLAGGAVTTSKLADGAVTPDKQTANAQMSSIAASVSSGTPSSLGTAPLVLGTSTHLVMLTSQGTFTCTAGCSSGNTVTVKWKLFDGTTAVGPEYTQTLADTMAVVPWTASGIAISTGSSAHTYTVKVTTTSSSATTVDVLGTLNAVDLGAQ